MHGRLVQEEQAGVLGDGHREHGQLPLAERQFAHVTPPQFANPHALDRGVDLSAVGRTQPAEPVLVRDSTERHEVLDDHRKGDDRLARDDGHQPRHGAAVDSG